MCTVWILRPTSHQATTTNSAACTAYPENLSQPWMRVNFVSSIDGCVAVDGVSGGLGTPADKSVFGILRELCDVVVVGAGTARAENYGGVQVSDEARARRTADGLAPVPPILVVSAHASIDPESRLLRDTEVPPILVVGRDADSAAISALRSAGAQVEVTDSPNVTSGDIDRALSARKLRHVLCEGGPSLFGQLIEDNAVDRTLHHHVTSTGGEQSRPNLTLPQRNAHSHASRAHSR